MNKQLKNSPSKCKQAKSISNEKGYILVETITLLLIFSVIIATFILMYGQVIKGREDRLLHYQAIMIVRSEMEKQELSIQPIKKVVNNYFDVEVNVRDYSQRIKEVQVKVKWQEPKGINKQIEVKRLIYQM